MIRFMYLIHKIRRELHKSHIFFVEQSSAYIEARVFVVENEKTIFPEANLRSENC